jgi:hypothetical protein
MRIVREQEADGQALSRLARESRVRALHEAE